MQPQMLRCRHCGGQFQIENGMGQCSYCDMRYHLGAQGQVIAEDEFPTVAAGQAQRSWVWAIGAVFVIALGAGVYRALSKPHSIPEPVEIPQRASNSKARVPMPSTPSMRWSAKAPLLVRIDDDEFEDIVGFDERYEGDIVLTANRGSDGEKLWTSGPVPDLGESDRIKVYLCGQTLLVTGPTGQLSGFALADGGQLWALRLQEEIERVYRHEGETVVLEMSDGSWQRIELVKGAPQPLPAEFDSQAWLAGPTKTLPCTTPNQQRGTVRLANPIFDRSVAGYSRFVGLSGKLVATAPDIGLHLMLGVQAKGTSVPVLLRYADDGEAANLTEVWRTPVAGVEPLRARLTGIPQFEMDADASTVVVVYEQEGGSRRARRLSGFEWQQGHRRWDVPLPSTKPFVSVTLQNGRVYVTVWGTLMVFEGEAGNLLFFVGAEPN